MVFDIIKSEYERLDDVESFLKQCNIEVWREVIPDQCNHWELPYKVDMIFSISNYGLIGVEGKKINTHGQGSKYAQAYLQIRDKYKDKTYFNGKKIRRWCVFGAASSDAGGERVECFIKHFFNSVGISFLTFIKNQYTTQVSIDSLTKNKLYIKKYKITGDDKENFLDYGENIK